MLVHGLVLMFTSDYYLIDIFGRSAESLGMRSMEALTGSLFELFFSLFVLLDFVSTLRYRGGRVNKI